MLNKKVAELLNDQINKEFYSSYLYLDFANYFAIKGLNGFASWYNIQAQEEVGHAMKIREYLLANGNSVKLEAIDKPDKKLASDLAVLEAGLSHEEFISSSINDIYAAAHEAKEFKTMEFLNYFIKEQVEEEKNAHTLIDEFKLFASTPEGLFLLNKQLSERK